VREAVQSLLTLEGTAFPDFVVEARIEVAEALSALLDRHGYDSGKRSEARESRIGSIPPQFMDGDIVVDAQALRLAAFFVGSRDTSEETGTNR
jgi:hypothetical protein